MGDNEKKVLEMLAEGKISVEEATRLLSLLNKEPSGAPSSQGSGYKPNAKYLFVKVEPKAGSDLAKNARVNIRVPLSLIHAGMKLSAVIPTQVADDVNRGLKEKGISFDIRNLKEENVDQFVNALRDTEIFVDSIEAEIRISAE